MKSILNIFIVSLMIALSKEDNEDEEKGYRYHYLKDLRPTPFSSREDETFLKLDLNIDKNAIVVAYADLNNDKQYLFICNYILLLALI